MSSMTIYRHQGLAMARIARLFRRQKRLKTLVNHSEVTDMTKSRTTKAPEETIDEVCTLNASCLGSTPLHSKWSPILNWPHITSAGDC